MLFSVSLKKGYELFLLACIDARISRRALGPALNQKTVISSS